MEAEKIWDEAFDTEMLNGKQGIAVNCPDRDLERELAAILTAYGLRYYGGVNLLSRDRWEQYKNSFCYFVDVAGRNVKYGPKFSTDVSPWNGYKKCTFYGEQQEDISDESFSAILGR